MPTPHTILLPDTLHVDTAALVERFAEALAKKLLAAQKKYGYTNKWMEPQWGQLCQRELIDHVFKGDPLDVAAYAAFCWYHGWSTVPPLANTDGKAVRVSL